MNSIEALFGRLLVLIIYCSVVLTTIETASYYKMQTARKNAENFINEAYESGINDSLYFSFRNSQSSLGYNVTLSLTGKDFAMNDQEILTYIKNQPLIIDKNGFFVCELTSTNTVLRIGGRS